jgi:hypothetical protein
VKQEQRERERERDGGKQVVGSRAEREKDGAWRRARRKGQNDGERLSSRKGDVYLKAGTKGFYPTQSGKEHSVRRRAICSGNRGSKGI